MKSAILDLKRAGRENTMEGKMADQLITEGRLIDRRTVLRAGVALAAALK
jgi:hypothetical protein